MSSNYTISITIQGKDDASAIADKVTKSITGMGDAADRSSKGVGGFFRDAFAFATGGIITKAIGAVTGSFGALKDGMIGGNAAFEDYNTRFTTMLGSATAAKQRMAELADFGAKTPFELPQVVDADIVLQGFGLHSLEAAKKFGYTGEQIRTIAGDVASGTGQDFKEMSLLIGKFSSGATGEAIARMQELGITSRDELTKLGLSFSKSGQLTSPLPQAMNTVLTLMKRKYGGLMDAQSSTFNGMLSNLQDWIAGTLRTIGQPIFEVLKDKLAVVVEFLSKPETQAAVNEFAAALANGVGVAMDFIANTAIPALMQGWTNLQPTIATVSAIALTLAGIWTTNVQPALATVVDFISANLQPILTGLVTVLLTVVVPAFIAWAGSAVAAATATVVALAPVLIPLAAIGVAAAVLRAAWDNDWGGIRTTLTDFWTTTGQPIFDQVREWLEVNLPIAIATVSTFWNTVLLPALTAVWSFISTVLIPIIVEIATNTFTTFNAATQGVADLWNNSLKPAFNAVWSFLNTYIIPLFTAIANVHLALFQVAVELLVKVWNEKLSPALKAVWSFLEGWLVPSINALRLKGLSALGDQTQTVSHLWSNTLKPALETVSSFITSTAAPVMDTLSSAARAVSSAISGIGGVVESAIAWLNKLASAIRSIPSMPSFGGGGGGTPGYASGTTFAPGGMAWVGERGPELVNLNRGAQVYTAAQSARMAGGTTNHYHLTANYGHQDERSLRDDIRYLQMLTG
jgi:phage-related protein